MIINPPILFVFQQVTPIKSINPITERYKAEIRTIRNTLTDLGTFLFWLAVIVPSRISSNRISNKNSIIPLIFYSFKLFINNKKQSIFSFLENILVLWLTLRLDLLLEGSVFQAIHFHHRFHTQSLCHLIQFHRISFIFSTLCPSLGILLYFFSHHSTSLQLLSHSPSVLYHYLYPSFKLPI